MLKTFWAWLWGDDTPERTSITLHGAHPLASLMDAGKCPDCGGREFAFGPSGGMCQNIQCECGSKFNIGVAPGFGIIHAERI